LAGKGEVSRNIDSAFLQTSLLSVKKFCCGT